MTTQKKIAVVTGGSSGIGAAVVRKLVALKIKVYVLDIKKTKEKNPDVQNIECDLGDFQSVKSAFEKIYKEEGHVDYLILNAGIYHYGTLVETSLEDMNQVLNVNFKGAFHCLKSALPIMEKRLGGSIVIVGSDQSIIGKKNNAIYGATKGALAQLTKSTALDYGTKNIRVNCVCPGAIDTPLYHQAVKSYAEKYLNGNITEAEEQVRNKHPLGRIGKPEEVANLIWFLCSDEASFMTGSIVSVDGGYTAQ